ncbi:MAG: hypothetical protein J2O39_10505, partial [Acidimicrobiales bacterium]|nr:hypothetical protein [Acidimicrobiales bacterium]
MSEDAAPGPAGGPKGADPAAAETGTPARPPRSWRRRLISLSLRRGLLALLAVFVILYLLVPQVAGARNDLQLLGRVNV